MLSLKSAMTTDRVLCGYAPNFSEKTCKACALAIMAASDTCGLITGLNAPYSAADDVTHTLRLQATPYALPNAMLEIRNDLIATPAEQEAMADCLAPILLQALTTTETSRKAG